MLSVLMVVSNLRSVTLEMSLSMVRLNRPLSLSSVAPTVKRSETSKGNRYWLSSMCSRRATTFMESAVMVAPSPTSAWTVLPA